MKRIFLLFVFCASILCSWAHDFEVNGFYYDITSSTDLAVAVTFKGSSYSEYSNEYSGIVSIPESVTYNSKTYRVTSIGDWAFYGCSSLTAITIPESVKSIGRFAFSRCSSLTSITISEGVQILGDYAFSYCSALTSVTIPSSITGIGASVFSSSTGGELIVNCNIPSASSDSQGAFSGSNFSKVIIGDGVTSIGDYAFYDCSSLTSLTLPESVTSIGDWAFCNCSGLTGDLLLPESLVSIGELAFYGCIGYNGKLVIGSNVREIKDIAFTRSTSIGNSFIENKYYFLNFSEVICKSIVVPSAVAAHSESWSYSTLYVTNYKGTFGFFQIEPSQCTLYVPTGIKSAYEVANGWKQFTNIVEMDMEENYMQIEILDSQESFSQSEDKLYDSITYKRNFKNTNWQALYVPFEIPVTEDFLTEYEVAYINNVHQRDYDDDGDVDNTEIEAFKITKGTLRANYPYLIRAKEVGEKAIIVSNATLYATKENSIDCASVFSTYTFTGTYSRLSSDVLPQSGGYYALSGGTFRLVADGTSLGAFRYYLHIVPRNGETATKIQAIRMRIMDENGNEDITHVDDCEIVYSSEEVVYDLQGRKVFHPAHGVYIVNGKKVIF